MYCNLCNPNPNNPGEHVYCDPCKEDMEEAARVKEATGGDKGFKKSGKVPQRQHLHIGPSPNNLGEYHPSSHWKKEA